MNSICLTILNHVKLWPTVTLIKYFAGVFPLIFLSKIVTRLCIMLKNDQTCFKNLVGFTHTTRFSKYSIFWNYAWRVNSDKIEFSGSNLMNFSKLVVNKLYSNMFKPNLGGHLNGSFCTSAEGEYPLSSSTRR